MRNTDSALETAIERALRAAIKAPSPHNTQPWRFEVAGDRIEVWLDPRRILPVADQDGREARLSCGAALFNLRLGLRAAGRALMVDMHGDQRRPDHLATVWVKGIRAASPEEARLAAAIDHRHTNRRPFLDRAVPAKARNLLIGAAGNEGSRLILLEQPSQLSALADLLRRADHLQTEDSAFQAELRRWVVDRPDRDDGVPASAGGPRPSDGSVLALRQYGETPSARDRRFEQDPLVAVLATPGDSQLAQVRAGEAMQRLLLVATAEGLSSSFLSQPMEISSTRAALRALIGGRDWPQTVLRLGYGHAAADTPRRAVHTVTDFNPPAR